MPHPLSSKKWNANSKNDIGLRIRTTHNPKRHSVILQSPLFLDPIALTVQETAEARGILRKFIHKGIDF